MTLVQNIINFLLFLMPGMLSMQFEKAISEDNDQSKSELERTTRGILLSIPVFILSLLLIKTINWLWVRLFNGHWWQLTSIKTLEVWLNSLEHLGVYILCSFVSACIIGIIWTTQRSRYIKVINWMRKKMGRADRNISMVWDQVFNNREEVVVSLKTKDGNEVKGFLRKFSQSSDKFREITIDGFDVVEKFVDYIDKPAFVYYHFESGTTLTFYDMAKCIDYAKQIKEDNNNTINNAQ